MTSNHVLFLKSIITKPLHLLRKDFDAAKHGRKNSTLTPDISGVVIDGIFEEEFTGDPKSGRKLSLHRIFARSAEGKEYCDVGWVLNDDINVCMLCRNAFSAFSYQHHCKACGNIVCSNCSQGTAPIHELQYLGTYRVCNFCYFGQDEVFVISNRPLPPRANNNGNATQTSSSSPFSSGRKGTEPPSGSQISSTVLLPSVPVEETLEEKQQRLQREQQEEFKNAALRRIRRNSAISRSVIVTDPWLAAQIAAIPATSSGSSSSNSNGNNNNLVNNGGLGMDQTSTFVGEDPHEIQTADRARLLTSHGAMRVIVPSTGYVLKTKRPNGTKIFVNIVSSPLIPHRPEPAPASASSGGGKVDMNKKINMLLNTPFEANNDKDGSYCILYDLVVHPDELLVVSLDATGEYRNRLHSQVAALIMRAYKEELAMAMKVLQLSANYKGSAVDTDSGAATVRPILMPTAEAFAAVDNGQIAALPVPLNTMNGNANNNDGRMSLLNGNGRGSIATNRLSTLSMDGKSNYQQRGSIILESLGDSATLGLDKTLKAMVLPKEDMVLLFGRNFNHVLEKMEAEQVKLRDLLLYPEPGFVFATTRLRPQPPRRLYVNVTHQLAVGMMSKRGVPSVGEEGIPQPCPVILGAVDASFDDGLGQGSADKAIVVDLVIPTSVFLACVADSSGDIRNELVRELLDRITELGLRLSREFTLLSEPAYLTAQPDETAPIPPVLNLTEDEKKRLSAAFIGKLHKQGHGVKSWKERLVLVADAKLQYFDLKMNFKGEFVTEDCTVDGEWPLSASGREASFSAHNIPAAAFPFQVVSYASGGQFLNCYVGAEHMRDLFHLALQTRNAHISALKLLVSIPSMKTGWLLKQGHVVKNWKRRFFVLNYGVLSYYEQDGVASNGIADIAKGKIELKSASVTSLVEEGSKATAENELRVLVTDVRGAKLIVQMKTRDEKKEWFDALKKHVLYANEYND